MSAITAAGAIQRNQIKPPVKYAPDAVKAAIAHEAANGPSHVRIRALNMMARMMGLYDHAKTVVDKAKNSTTGVWDKMVAIKNGTHKVTAEDIADFATESSDDEEASSKDDDDVP